MTFSRDPEGLEAMAVRLCGRPLARIAPLGGGWNNRVYRVECRDGTLFALKLYPSQLDDPRDRLGTEYQTLLFLGSCGISESPKAITVSRQDGCAIYEWIEGAPVRAVAAGDIDAALDFAIRLQELAALAEARSLPLASEACLSAAAVVDQIRRRIERLLAEGAEAATLKRFFDGPYAEALDAAEERARRGYRALDLDFEAELADEGRALSPSDFGFHNAIRKDDGTLCFIDFEYFGWDDPVKLTADFLHHPGMTLTPTLAARFADGARARLSSDPVFRDRLSLLFPLYGLRWCTILLNEFLPGQWARRTFAGAGTDASAARSVQLEKAVAKLRSVRACLADGPNGRS